MDDYLKIANRCPSDVDLSSCCICHSSPTAERILDIMAVENCSGSRNSVRKSRRVRKALKRRAKAKMKRFIEQDRVND